MISQGGKASDQIIVLAIAKSMLENLPQLLNMEEANESLFQKGENGTLNSLTTVLSQEAQRYNKLLITIRKSLVELEKAVKGLVVMSASLEKMFGSFLDNQVPELWQPVSFSSMKPLQDYIKDLQQRITILRDWMINGQPNYFWLPGFFFTQGRLTLVTLLINFRISDCYPAKPCKEIQYPHRHSHLHV
jgi:dynein heavy chain